MKDFLENSFKSLVILLGASFLFTVMITIGPLIWFIIEKDFHLLNGVIRDNFGLLIPLSSASILMSPIFGLISAKLRERGPIIRLVLFIGLGFLGCWIAILFTLIWMAGFRVSNITDVIFFTTVSTMAAPNLFLFSLPILIPSLYLLEIWTRRP